MQKIRLIILAFLFCGVLPPAVRAQPSRLAGGIDNGRRVTLSGRVPLLANARNDRGPVEGTFTLPGITLLLKPSGAQQSDLQQLLIEQQDAASPSFHRWLTPEQYADRFGASAGDMAQIVAWAQSQGLQVTNVARSRTFVSFSGTAQQAQAAFHTAIHRYSVNGQAHFANAADPSIPAALADLVAGVWGLNDFHPKPQLRLPAQPEMTASGGAHYLAPGDFATIYDVAPLYAAGVNGTGQSIAIVGQSDILLSDIQAFRKEFNLSPPNLVQKLVPGQPDPGISPTDQEESNLDIEWSGAVARNATIVFVYSGDVWQSAIYAVDQNLAPILSISYGACEQEDLVDLPSYRALVQQANAEGMTWFAASGDSGAAACDDLITNVAIAQNGLAVNEPASIPEVTAMGGTEFNEPSGTGYWSSTNTNGASALQYIPEMAWNDTALAGVLTATGGGASIYFPQPAWQTGPGVPADGARHVPDLALTASADHDSYYFYSNGKAGYVGGTSAATPTMAGIFALLNQYLVSTGAQPGLGNVNPTLYRLGQNPSGIFHPVPAGNNMVPCANGTPDCSNGLLGFAAGPAYDSVTGWGSVDAYKLVHAWSADPPLSSSVVPSIDQNPVFQQPPDTQGNSWQFTLTLTEEAGIGTTLTDFTIDGVSHAAEITNLFGSAAIAPLGSLSAAYGFASLPVVPATVVFGFAGVDAGGAPWTRQLSVPFSGPQAQLTVAGIGNAASGEPAYAPGMIVSVYGTALGDFAQSAAAIPLPDYLAGFEACVNGVPSCANGVPAPLYYVSPGQVNLQIPYETPIGQATLTVGNPYVNVNYNFTVMAASPGIFTFPDGSINPSRTASPGQEVTLFITGEGQVTPSLATGATPAKGTPTAQLPKPRLPVSMTVGGLPATIDFIGIPSGLVGVTQINFTVPAGIAPGVQPVVVTVGSAASPPATITITP
jgi:uncharacterized protein (TIGR03437 family)